MKLLFIGKIDPSNKDGALMVSKRNLDVLRSVFGESNVTVYSYKDSKSMHILLRLFLAIFGFSNGFRPKFLKKIERIVQNDAELKYVFLDSSLLGSCASSLRSIRKDLKIFAFFHNVEFDYFQASLRSSKRIWYFIYLLAAKASEKTIVRNADYLIGLNERDGLRLHDLYGKSFDLLLPTTFSDKYSDDVEPVRGEQLQMLFVGSAFFANIHGLDWFLKHVYPNLNQAKLTVVGSGFERLKPKYSVFNIEIVGVVEDLSPWYLSADLVISPILVGSGMKTKIAEALMYGKHIIATEEAMEGYQWDGYDIGLVSNAPEVIINYINGNRHLFKCFNYQSRQLFVDKYTIKSSEEGFLQFLNDRDLLFK